MKTQQRLDEYSFQYFHLLAAQCKKTYDEPNIVEETLEKLAKACEDLPGKKSLRKTPKDAKKGDSATNTTNESFNMSMANMTSDFKAELFWHKDILDCADHSGIAFHPPDSIVEEENNVTNETYYRGGTLNNCEAIEMKATLYFRDVVNDYIKETNINDLRILDLGSGRGGPSRFIAKTVKKARKLQMFVAADKNEEYNEYNQKHAKKDGLTSRYFRVDTVNFEDLSRYQDDSFDMIMSVDAFYQSKDKSRLVSELQRILAPSGILFFSDIVINATYSSEQNKEI